MPGDREARSIERARARRLNPLSRRARWWSAGRAGLVRGGRVRARGVRAGRAAAVGDRDRAARCGLCHRLAAGVRTATGVTVPNVLALVPMFVLLPPGLVPVAAVAGGLLGDAFAAQRWRGCSGRSWSRGPSCRRRSSSRYSTRAAAGAMPRCTGWPSRSGWSPTRSACTCSSAWSAATPTPGSPTCCGCTRSRPAGAAGVPRRARVRPVRVCVPRPFGVVFVFRELVRSAAAASSSRPSSRRAYHGTPLLGDIIEVDDRYTGLHSRGSSRWRWPSPPRSGSTRRGGGGQRHLDDPAAVES